MLTTKPFVFKKYPFNEEKSYITIVGDRINEKIINYFNIVYPEKSKLLETRSIDWTEKVKIQKDVEQNRGFYIFHDKEPSNFFYEISDLIVFTTAQSLKKYLKTYSCISEYLFTLNDEIIDKMFIIIDKKNVSFNFYTMDSTVFL